jgi:glycosyltransferase involved in cell wall biosynthesis
MGIEGLLPGEHAFLAQNSEESTATICDLARDPERRRRAERRARQLVEERYSWDLITSHLSAQLEAWGSAGESVGPGR